MQQVKGYIMVCILKSKRPINSRQISTCNRVVAGGGVHFRNLTEAKRSDRPICQECLDALGLSKSDVRPRKKRLVKAKPRRKSPRRQPLRVINKPPAPRFDRDTLLKNKELLIGCALVLLKHQGRQGQFLQDNVNAQIAVDYYYYGKTASSLVEQYTSTTSSIPNRARAGLVLLSELIDVDPFDYRSWPVESVWALQQSALCLAVNTPFSARFSEK